MERYVCVHGHFYQPPRENPWLEAIELQDSAYPYHDWNERISAECYGPNAASRILDDQGRVRRIVNNYGRISFNFGPTLLDWLQKHAPEVYQAVLEADRESVTRFSGHGSALAQAYNHMILPLASARDKRTQILWGISHFTHHFHRSPEGMWLPETAVDLETLDICAEQGIRFTILAPRQAARTRARGKRKWMDVSGGGIDPTIPYIQKLPSGRRIVIFFYDGPISRAVAFERILESGERFARRLIDGFSERHTDARLVHIATDGESYGHHHRHGDMALAYALHHLETQEGVLLTNYGEFLDKHRPKYEVQVFENSSWSCVHGIERWRGDCGCNSGGNSHWNQSWRRPLREALDWLRDTLAARFEAGMAGHKTAPWKARDDYIRVLLDRSPRNTDRFLDSHGIHAPSQEQKSAVLRMLEMQRHTMLMYTSCGWFFDELSGIETVQVIQYAGRALQLAGDLSKDLESGFLGRLERAGSNIPEHRDGRRIYENFVRPAMVDLERVGAHYAMSTLFEDYPERADIACYEVTREYGESAEAGRAKLAVGRIRVHSGITLESGRLCFGILHWGDHNLSGCVRSASEDEPTPETVKGIFEHFGRADFTATLKALEVHIGPAAYSLRNLFRDQQRKIVDTILTATLEDVEGLYRQVYEGNAPLLRFLRDLDIPRPAALGAASDLVTTADIRQALQQEDLDLKALHKLLETASLEGTHLDAATLEMIVKNRAEHLMLRIQEKPLAGGLLEEMNDLMDLVQNLPFDVNLRIVQNRYYRVYRQVYPEILRQAEKDDDAPRQWLYLFASLGRKLSVRVRVPKHP